MLVTACGPESNAQKVVFDSVVEDQPDMIQQHLQWLARPDSELLTLRN
jgi:hypothetical protein